MHVHNHVHVHVHVLYMYMYKYIFIYHVHLQIHIQDTRLLQATIYFITYYIFNTNATAKTIIQYIM